MLQKIAALYQPDRLTVLQALPLGAASPLSGAGAQTTALLVRLGGEGAGGACGWGVITWVFLGGILGGTSWVFFWGCLGGLGYCGVGFRRFFERPCRLMISTPKGTMFLSSYHMAYEILTPSIDASVGYQ